MSNADPTIKEVIHEDYTRHINPDGSKGGTVHKNAMVNPKCYVHTSVTIHGGNFYGGNFRGGNFRGGNFYGGYFYGGDFRGGNFYGGDFYGGNFRGGNF